MTYTDSKPRHPRAASYYRRARINGGEPREFTCIVGSISDACDLKRITLEANPGAKMYSEQIDYGIDRAFFEILMPSSSDKS